MATRREASKKEDNTERPTRRGWNMFCSVMARLVSRLLLQLNLSSHFKAGFVESFNGQTCPILSRHCCPSSSRLDLSNQFEAWLVQNTSRLDLSCGRTCPKVTFGPKTLRPEVSKSLGPAVAGFGLRSGESWSLGFISPLVLDDKEYIITKALLFHYIICYRYSHCIFLTWFIIS